MKKIALLSLLLSGGMAIAAHAQMGAQTQNNAQP